MSITVSPLDHIGAVRIQAQLDKTPVIPKGYRPLTADEDPCETDIVYDLLLNEWHEIGLDTLGLIEIFGFNNPVPLCRKGNG